MPAEHDRRLTGVSLLLAGASYALAAVRPADNPDTFGHLAQGRVIDENGWPPALDPFSFWQPEPRPWPNYEWLSDWIGFRVHALLGVPGLQLLTIALAALTAVLAVWLAARRAGPRASLACAMLSIAALPAVRFRMLARPDAVAIPLALAYLHLLPDAAASRGRKLALSLAALVALQIVWANLHGSHLLGVGVAGACAVAAWPDRRRAAIGAGATLLLVAASCVTPFGARLAIDAARHVFDPELRSVVTEWRAWDPDLPLVWLLAPLVAGLALAAGTRPFLRADPAIRGLALTAVLLLVPAFRSIRFLPQEMIIAATAVATLPLWDRLPTRAQIAAVAASFVVAGAGLASTDDRLGFGLGTDTRLVPAEACATIEHDFPGARVLAVMPASWYVLFGAPSARVLLDGRVPFYGAAHVARTTVALHDPSALDELLRDYPIELLLLQPTSPDEARVVASVSSDPRFAVVYLDATWVIFARRGGRFDDVIARRELTALRPGFDAYAILDASDDRARELRAELGRLGDGPEGRALASWVRASLRLRPLARAGGRAGLRAPRDEDERRRLELAERELSSVRERVRDVQAVMALSLLVAIDRCDTEAADELLAATLDAGGEVRETIFARAELDIRRGRLDAVRAMISSARSMPGAAGDPWLAMLEEELADPPRCP